MASKGILKRKVKAEPEPEISIAVIWHVQKTIKVRTMEEFEKEKKAFTKHLLTMFENVDVHSEDGDEEPSPVHDKDDDEDDDPDESERELDFE